MLFYYAKTGDNFVNPKEGEEEMKTIRTGIVKDWRYREHNPGTFHPESPQRVEAIYEMLERDIHFPLQTIEPRSASEGEILYIHSPSHLQRIKETSGKERMSLDPDTATSPRSYEIALLAVGGVLKAADEIMKEKIENGFAAVRPPGHHAEPHRAMGFCLFNNVAIAAEHLVRKHRLQKILIVDWDLHHGNGTQIAFYSRKDILYFSTHQYPYYPGSGFWDEVGRGEGEGYTVNVPLYPGKGDEEYLFIFKKILEPIASTFKPEFILVSAGFDIYSGDPLGGMRVSEKGFGFLAAELIAMARKFSQGRILFVLEGGYNLNGLSQGVKNVLTELRKEKLTLAAEPRISPFVEKELTPVFQILKKYFGIA